MDPTGLMVFQQLQRNVFGWKVDVNFGYDSDAVSVGSCKDSGALRGDSLDFRDSTGFRRGLWNSW
ncbi:hypothetical protein K0M31_011630 [Melipona bicolor]|uniref:Uncharacterized protein n=1 Tax=Melipona bicolor TaxID=60889 RepID=A0AA40GA00_9HYME|nr:hypothetical protein K0M31_011630 [Melipona bicolor]